MKERPRSTGPLAIQFLDLAETVKCIPDLVRRLDGQWVRIDPGGKMTAVLDVDEAVAEGIIGCVEGMVREGLAAHGRDADLLTVDDANASPTAEIEFDVKILKRMQEAVKG